MSAANPLGLQTRNLGGIAWSWMKIREAEIQLQSRLSTTGLLPPAVAAWDRASGLPQVGIGWNPTVYSASDSSHMSRVLCHSVTILSLLCEQGNNDGAEEAEVNHCINSFSVKGSLPSEHQSRFQIHEPEIANQVVIVSAKDRKLCTDAEVAFANG
jgi:hypothetical protein